MAYPLTPKVYFNVFVVHCFVQFEFAYLFSLTLLDSDIESARTVNEEMIQNAATVNVQSTKDNMVCLIHLNFQ
jgi:hypothetical protein